MIDEKARWIALWLYLVLVFAGLLERKLAAPRIALSRIGDSLLLVVMSIGLVAGGVTTIGAAAACAALIGRTLVRSELSRSDPVRFADSEPAVIGRAATVLTVASFAAALAPRIAGVPRSVDTHTLGGFMLMACGVLALASLSVELVRRRRSAIILRE